MEERNGKIELRKRNPNSEDSKENTDQIYQNTTDIYIMLTIIKLSIYLFPN